MRVIQKFVILLSVIVVIIECCFVKAWRAHEFWIGKYLDCDR